MVNMVQKFVIFACVKYNSGTMSSDQLDFVTYCIGNLSMRLQLPQRTIYLKLKDSGILENYIVKGYEVLHTFGKEYLMDDLITYMQEKELYHETISLFYSKS